MNVVELRKTLGYTQQQLGAILGVHAMTVSSWENQRSKPPPHHTALMRAFDLAAQRDPNAAEMALTEITAHGFARALYRLLSAAYKEDEQ